MQKVINTELMNIIDFQLIYHLLKQNMTVNVYNFTGKIYSTYL